MKLLQAPPQPKYVAFGGTGRTLGSATPVPASEAPAASPGLEAANQPFQGLVVDESKPSTSIQVCL
jgi:UBX domain-containing protein 1